MKQARWDLKNIATPLRRAGQRRLVIDAAHSEASVPGPVSPLARLVSETLLAGLIFVSVFAVVFAWLTSIAWSLTAAITATGLTRIIFERATASDAGKRRRRARVQAVLRETAKMLTTADTEGFLTALTRCLHRLDYERPQIQSGFGPGGEGMVMASNGERRIAIYYVVDGSAVLDSDAVIIAASELARIDCARHFFATTGEFTPAAYQRAERVGITLIDRYELVGLFAADEARLAGLHAAKADDSSLGTPRWHSEPSSVSGRLEDNRRRITGHWRVALLLAVIALISPGNMKRYLLVLVAVNAIALVYRQWLNFRLLAVTGSELPDDEASLARPAGRR